MKVNAISVESEDPNTFNVSFPMPEFPMPAHPHRVWVGSRWAGGQLFSHGGIHKLCSNNY